MGVLTIKPEAAVAEQAPRYNPDIFAGCEITTDLEMDVPDDVFDLCEELEDAGAMALVVGGAARDLKYGDLVQQEVAPKDLDLEIYGMSQEVLESFLKAKFGKENVSEEGKSYRVFKVKVVGLAEPLDVSVPRTDKYVGPARTAVETTETPDATVREAAFRRDTTVNALAFRITTGELIDPYGGVSDIEAGILRMVSPETFPKDPLRALRIVQQAARTGMTVEAATMETCRDMVAEHAVDMVVEGAKSMRALSSERVADEFQKLLVKGRFPSYGIQIMRDMGLFEQHNGAGHPPWEALVPLAHNDEVWQKTLAAIDRTAAVTRREFEAGRLVETDDYTEFRDAVEEVQLAVLLAGLVRAGGTPRDFLDQLQANHFSTRVKELALISARALTEMADFWDEDLYYHAASLADELYARQKEGTLYAFSLAAEALFGDADAAEGFREYARERGILEKPPEPLVNGRFLVDLGFRGSAIGEALTQIRDAQLRGVLETPEDVKTFLKI